MRSFDSQFADIMCPAQKAYDFLTNFNNFGKLMPPEITNWKSTQTECSFTIAGMADLSMKLGQCTPYQLITMISNGKNPFDFQMIATISALAENHIQAKIQFSADLNPMIANMAAKPLTNFVDMLILSLKQKLESLD